MDTAENRAPGELSLGSSAMSLSDVADAGAGGCAEDAPAGPGGMPATDGAAAPAAAHATAAAAAAGPDEASWHAVLAILDQFAIGLCLVDAGMRVVLISGRAVRSGAFTVKRGRLGAACAEDERRLRAAVAGVLGPEGPPLQGLCLGPSAQPTRAFVTMVDVPASDGGASGGRLAAVVVPSTAAPDHREHVIQGMFGLTRVEAAITKLLSDGVPPNEAAERTRLRPNTLRGYMKAIFAKLDVHRQSDLVRLVSTTAGLVRVPRAASSCPGRTKAGRPAT